MNEFLGWAFLAAGVISVYSGDLGYAFSWLVLGKLCWIHEDIQKQRT